jgi:hypothetical protein
LCISLASCGTYGYLRLDTNVVADSIWIESCVNAINCIKTNDEYGYKVLDMTGDFKKYKTAKRQFESAVEKTFKKIATGWSLSRVTSAGWMCKPLTTPLPFRFYPPSVLSGRPGDSTGGIEYSPCARVHVQAEEQS